MFNEGICVESGFRFYAVVSGCEALQKTMKNPLFRAYYEEAAGIAQGRFCGTHFAVKIGILFLCRHLSVEQRGMLLWKKKIS